ncbi:unnamed protein product [Leuciscus chuanchicus]
MDLINWSLNAIDTIFSSRSLGSGEPDCPAGTFAAGYTMDALERWRVVCLAALCVEDVEDIYLFGTMITGTDEHTHLLIRWRVAHEALFTGKRNAAIKGFESFVVEQDLQGRVTAAFVKKKWENLKQKYKDLKCTQTGVSTEDGGATAASWKWYAAMDEAIGGRPSITPPALVASCGPDVAVASSSSVRPEPARPRKRVKDLEDLIQEMEEREEERERKAAEREERLWREMEEKEDRRERERRERDERQEREVREREERWHREASEREERRDKETKERDEKFLSVLEILAKK